MSPKPQPRGSDRPGGLGLLRVLVIDDSPDERFVVRRGLDRSPDARFEVVEADTATAGLAITREEVFDAVVVDHLLPDRTGLELVRDLRAREPDLALVLLTGRGSDEVATAALEAGVDDYLNKNALADPRQLGRAVRGAVDRARLRTALAEGNEALACAHAELLGYQEELERLVQSRTVDLEREVIQRREAEEALRAQQEQYERATQAGGVGLFEVDLETKRVFVDPTVADLLGQPPPTVDQTWITQRVDPQDWSEARARLDAHLRGDLDVFEMEIRLARADGELGWFQLRATSTRDEAGRPIRLSGTLLDTTARKRAEIETERYAQALSRSNAELEQFAHVASHDLRAPLRKIRSFGERLAVDYGERLDERGRDYLQRVCTVAVRLERLVDHVFAYSRAQAEPATRDLVSLDRVVSAAWHDLDELADATGARLERPAALPRVLGDPVQLQQLFANLFSNAMKYRHPERAPTVTVNAARDDHGLTVRVNDDGVGFEPEAAEAIFEPFLRLSDDPRVDGTGMGLAICRRVVERHNGFIRATGHPGVGATFEIRFPDPGPGSPRRG